MSTRDTTAFPPGVKLRAARLERMKALARGVNLPLVAIFAAGLAFSAYYALQVRQWVVMTDELQYAKLALNAANTLSPVPTVRGEYIASFSQLYPILMAPFYGVLDVPAAFKAVHLLNAALMASTAIPAYLLVRELTPSRLGAYLAAALTVAVPWMTMSTMLLTEVVGYPAFVWAALAMQRAIAEPSVNRDLLALGAIALAFLARTQFILLALVFPLAIVMHEIGFAALSSPRPRFLQALESGSRRAIASHRPVFVAAALGTVAALSLVVAGSLAKVLGNYEAAATGGNLLPSGIWRSAAIHLDYVGVGIGILPLVVAAGWAFGTLLRPLEKRTHAFATLLVVVAGALTFEVASFNLRFALGGPIQDRYLFYIVPLLFVGMVVFFGDERRRWAGVAAAGAFFAWLFSLADYVPAGIPFFSSPDTVFHSVLDGQSYRLGRLFSIHDLSPTTVVSLASLALGCAAAVAVRYAPRQLALACAGFAVLGFCAVETAYVFDKVVPKVSKQRTGSLVKAPWLGRDWIDRSVPGDASVALVPSSINSRRDGKAVWFGRGTTQAVWLDAEFWNESVDRNYLYDGTKPYAPFHDTRLSLDFETGALRVSDPARYLVVASSDVRLRLQAEATRNTPSDFDLLRAKLPYRAAWATRSLSEDGWTTPGKPVLLRLYPNEGRRASGRRVTVVMQSAPEMIVSRSYSIRASGAIHRRVIESRARRNETFKICVPANRPADVRIKVRGSTRLPDRRLIGLRITRISVVGTRAVC